MLSTLSKENVINAIFQAAKRAPRVELLDQYKRLHNRVVRPLHSGKKL